MLIEIEEEEEEEEGWLK